MFLKPSFLRTWRVPGGELFVGVALHPAQLPLPSFLPLEHHSRKVNSLLPPPFVACLSRPYAYADVRIGSSPDDSKDWNVLLDLNHLNVVPKTVRPLERQLPDESRKLWEKVTNKLVGKEFGEANKYKQAIEQRQREEAAERKKKGVE